MFCFEICTPEGRGGEKGGSENFNIKHPELLTQEIIPPCTCFPLDIRLESSDLSSMFFR